MANFEDVKVQNGMLAPIAFHYHRKLDDQYKLNFLFLNFANKKFKISTGHKLRFRFWGGGVSPPWKYF